MAGKLELKDNRALTKAGIIYWAKVKKEPYPKVNSRGNKDLAVKSEVLKLVEENTGEHLSDLQMGKEFLRHKTANHKRKGRYICLLYY